jgi:hypothetical protein
MNVPYPEALIAALAAEISKLWDEAEWKDEVVEGINLDFNFRNLKCRILYFVHTSHFNLVLNANAIDIREKIVDRYFLCNRCKKPKRNHGVTCENQEFGLKSSRQYNTPETHHTTPFSLSSSYQPTSYQPTSYQEPKVECQLCNVRFDESKVRSS